MCPGASVVNVLVASENTFRRASAISFVDPPQPGRRMSNDSSGIPSHEVALHFGDLRLGLADLMFDHVDEQGSPNFVGELRPTADFWNNSGFVGSELNLRQPMSLSLRTLSGLPLPVETLCIHRDALDGVLTLEVSLARSIADSGTPGAAMTIEAEACGYCSRTIDGHDRDRVAISVTATSGEVFGFSAHRTCFEQSLGEQLRKFTQTH